MGVVEATDKSIIVLVLDMFHDEVGRAESFLADYAHILSAFVDRARIFYAEFIFLLDKDLVFLRVCWLIRRSFREKFLSFC